MQFCIFVPLYVFSVYMCVNACIMCLYYVCVCKYIHMLMHACIQACDTENVIVLHDSQDPYMHVVRLHNYICLGVK